MARKIKKAVTVEHIHHDENGKPYFEEIYGYPILDQEGNDIQLIEYYRNITERKLAKAA